MGAVRCWSSTSPTIWMPDLGGGAGSEAAGYCLNFLSQLRYSQERGYWWSQIFTAKAMGWSLWGVPASGRSKCKRLRAPRDLRRRSSESRQMFGTFVRVWIASWFLKARTRRVASSTNLEKHGERVHDSF